MPPKPAVSPSASACPCGAPCRPGRPCPACGRVLGAPAPPPAAVAPEPADPRSDLEKRNDLLSVQLGATRSTLANVTAERAEAWDKNDELRQQLEHVTTERDEARAELEKARVQLAELHIALDEATKPAPPPAPVTP